MLLISENNAYFHVAQSGREDIRFRDNHLHPYFDTLIFCHKTSCAKSHFCEETVSVIVDDVILPARNMGQ